MPPTLTSVLWDEEIDRPLTFAEMDELDAAVADASRETVLGLPARPGVTR